MKKIINKNVTVLPFLIGSRSLIYRDFEEFDMHFSAKSYYSPLYVGYFNRKQNHFQKNLVNAEKQAIDLINQDQNPIVIFPILSMMAAKEARALIECFKRLKAIREDVFIYPIIWDEYANNYLYTSGIAVYLFIDMDAPTVGAIRITQYIERIMGYDLPGGLFPEYTQEDANKMARHINFESFNAFGRKAGAIPKYPIIDGKAHFPVLYAKEKCPHCGHENEIFRGWLNKDGNVEIACRGRSCYETISFEGIGDKFDPWPEFDEYRSQSA